MTTALLQEDLRVVLDRWPARVLAPDGVTHTARAVLTRATDVLPAELLIWVAAGRTPELLTRVEWLPARSSVPLDGSGTWTVTTADGATWQVLPGRGCAGCGSIFRDWQPTTINRRYALPTDLGAEL